MSTIAEPRQFRRLDAQIKSVWRRGQLLHFAAGTLAFFRWAVPLFLVGMAVDWATDMPIAGRVLILILLLGVSLYKAWQCGWRQLRPFDPARTALQLENHHGGLDSLLISAIQLRQPAAGAGVSEALRDKTCLLAEEAASTLRPGKAVPFRGLLRPVIIVLLLAGLMGAFALAGGPFLVAGLGRIFAPWLAVEYPTYTQLELVQGDLVVKQGASAQIEARIAGIVPSKAKLLLRTGEGRPREIVLDVDGDDKCAYTIDSASRDFTYQIKAGDARSDWQQVRVISAPRVEQLKVDLEFPDYLDRAAETVEALTLTVPEGTDVNWQLTLNQSVSKAVFIRDGEEPLELHVGEDGHQVTFRATASDSRGYRFSWVDKEHGFEFESPRYYLQVASDQPPRVEITSPSSNLIAMPGRPLDLAARVQDDHAIGVAKVAYRVNRRPEESVALPSPLRNGEGEQAIDWDYRSALPDLDVGDTVAFAVEVSDKYPGPQGPHRARSETRRITLLSKEDYLKQIGRKIDRLLSGVRTIYRQQRAAHQLVRELDAENDSFTQSCQLEAIRQEMVRNQLNEAATEMQMLLDDLAANNISDAPEGDTLIEMRLALQTIAEEHVADAASLLRTQAGAPSEDTSSKFKPAPAARAINTAARELGSLVLLRDIDSAQEVYAREARMLAESQALLRWRTSASDVVTGLDDISQQQNELADWTERLISDLQNGMRYEKRPLAVLRLIRSVKELQGAETGSTMRNAGELIRQGENDQASALQADLVRTLLNAEFSVRLSGAYSTMLRTRDSLEILARSQMQLRKECDALDAKAFDAQRPVIARQQTELRRQLLTLLLPSIPAPRAELFDEVPPTAPPVEKLLADADEAMAKALLRIEGNDETATTLQQAKAEEALVALTEIVRRWSVEMGLKTQGLGTLVAASSERMSRIEEYEARVIGILEKTDIAVSEEEKVDELAESAQVLAEDLGRFVEDLQAKHQAEPDRDLPSLFSRLRQAQLALETAVHSLTGNESERAIENQEQTADALAEAYAIAAAQSERLSMLQDLLMFQRAVGFANKYMTDIVAEQRDLLAATEVAESEDVPKLLPVFGNLQRCIEDVAPLLDLVAARLDVGTPLAFAKTDLEDAIASLEIGDKLDAVDAQDVAVESLAEVQTLIQAVQSQTGYVAEIVEFLHGSTSAAAMLEYEQRLVAAKLVPPDSVPAQPLAEEQRALIAKAGTYSRQLEGVTGMPEFAEVADLMGDALEQLEAGESESAAEQMELAALVLTENTESLVAMISTLHGLPSFEVNNQTPSEIVRLIDVLTVACDHKSLLRETGVADPKSIAELADRQKDLASRCQQIAQTGETHPLLIAASEHLAEAASQFTSSNQEVLRQSQKAADDKLRHFIIEQALVLDTSIKYSSSEGDPGDGGEGSDSESALTAGFISDFVSGEAPKDQRTEWKVLGDRNRAALNQNFARELPLEYRGLLKNYYERLSK